MLVREAEKTVINWHCDSRVWSRLSARPGDIVVGTPPKCGTTWTQRILSMLLNQSAAPVPIMQTQPWLDARFVPLDLVLPMLEAAPGRRSLKTHLPFDAIPLHDDTLYIHVTRDPRDGCMSYHNHCVGHQEVALKHLDEWGLAEPSIGVPYPRPPESPRDFFRRWLRDPAYLPFDDYTSREMFALERSFWAERHRPNVLMVHYNDMKADLDGEMRRIAAFLQIETPDTLWPDLVEAATFAAMQRDGDALIPHAAMNWRDGAKTFLYKGTNERWRDVLTEADIADYDAAAAKGMSPSLRAWVENGRLVAGDPVSAPD